MLGVEIRLVDQRYTLCAPNRRLDALRVHYDEIANAEYCIKHELSLARMLAHLDAVARGHKRSVEKLDNAAQFQARVDSCHSNAVAGLMKSLIGSGAYSHLTPAKKAVLGITAFPSQPPRRKRSKKPQQPR